MCSRAVADANKHPAPSKFRQLTAPKIFETMRKQRENAVKIEQVCKRLSYRGHHLSVEINTRSSSRFATDDLPFIKGIIPEGEIFVICFLMFGMILRYSCLIGPI